MHVSLAQSAADDFNEFCEYDNEGAEALLDQVASQDERGPMYANLEYVSDWLHFWLLTGLASRATGWDYGVYMQTVAIILADRDSPEWEKMKGAFPPADKATMKAQDQFFSETGYVLPCAISPEMYAISSRLSEDARVVALRSLLLNTAHARYELPHA